MFVVFSLAVSMNANIKNSKIKNCPYPKYVMIKRPNLYNFTDQKKTSENDQELKFIKEPLISILAKNLRWSEKKCILCRPDMYNLKTRKKIRTSLIVRNKLSLN